MYDDDKNEGHLKRLGINMDGLEMEMRAAMAKDSRYWLENDAKLRAVEQRVPTYEHFRQLVAGCHLKSLDKGELLNQTVNKQHNWGCSTGSVINPSSMKQPLKEETLVVQKVCVTAAELLCSWRSIYLSEHLDGQTKYIKLSQLLTSQPPALLKSVFDSGLGMTMLPEILQVFDQLLTDKTSSSDTKSYSDVCISILTTLSNFTQSNQFPLASLCLSDREQQIGRHMLDLLAMVIGEIDELHTKYATCLKTIQSDLGLL